VIRQKVKIVVLSLILRYIYFWYDIEKMHWWKECSIWQLCVFYLK